VSRYLVSILTLLTVASVGLAANVAVTLNGQAVTLPVIDSNGKAFVDAAALMQLLGGKATYDAGAGKLYIATTTSTATGSPAAAWGTAQLPGDEGKIGQVYALRKSDPLDFRLNSAEFTVSQVRIGEETYAPKANEKLLVLHYSVQNPQKEERIVRFDSLRFTVVDAMNVNHEGIGEWGDAQSGSALNLSLKPAQRVEAYTIVVVPAKGPIPKLMVMPPDENDGPVVRYDLRGKVTPLQPPVADPTDPTGATALETVPAQLNTPCSCSNFDVTVEKTEYITTALDGDPPGEGERYFVVTLLAKNKAGADAILRFDTFKGTLADADGQEFRQCDTLIGGTSNRAFDQGIKPNAEARVRIYFTVPKDVNAKTLSLREGESRTYEFGVQ